MLTICIVIICILATYGLFKIIEEVKMLKSFLYEEYDNDYKYVIDKHSKDKFEIYSEINDYNYKYKQRKLEKLYKIDDE